MKKKVISVLLAGLLVLGLSGCQGLRKMTEFWT